MQNSPSFPLVCYKDSQGNDIFRIERSGMVYIKGLVMHDGTSANTVPASLGGGGSTDGGTF